MVTELVSLLVNGAGGREMTAGLTTTAAWTLAHAVRLRTGVLTEEVFKEICPWTFPATGGTVRMVTEKSLPG